MNEQKGGKGNFNEDRNRASESGRKGGQQSGSDIKKEQDRPSDTSRKGGGQQGGGGRDR
ncbi:stress-induced protein [Pseudomonas taiwanensis]|uniref:KGG domain-containing protein n=1 Tax=Pseudomonas taiwanensis TaxID=470150 RepID=UPI0015BD8E18|nr:KGG domain-containing protein [Pseudomonas taiwanensis]NWL76509.1 stress-induced protein [Pseudomonas taiwanensis]